MYRNIATQMSCDRNGPTEWLRPKRSDRNGQTETARPNRPDRIGQTEMAQTESARPKRPDRIGQTEKSCARSQPGLKLLQFEITNKCPLCKIDFLLNIYWWIQTLHHNRD